MENEFVPYEEALALKELGFDEVCLANWKNKKTKIQLHFKYYLTNKALIGTDVGIVCTAPLYQQAFRWFREKYGLHYIVCKNIQIDGYGYREVIQIPYMEEDENTIFRTYEEAKLECLKKLIEMVKNK